MGIVIKLPYEPELIRGVVHLLKDFLDQSGEEGELAITPQILDDDRDMRDLWEDELKQFLKSDCSLLFEFLLSPAIEKDSIEIDEYQVEAALRACSAIRLHIRQKRLQEISEESLETGKLDMMSLSPDVQKMYVCYLFLASFQVILIEAIDPDAAEEF